MHSLALDTDHSQHLRSQLEAQEYKSALSLIDSLLTELKRLDDKMILTEVHLLESRVYRGIRNFPKAKVSSFAGELISVSLHLQRF